MNELESFNVLKPIINAPTTNRKIVSSDATRNFPEV